MNSSRLESTQNCSCEASTDKMAKEKEAAKEKEVEMEDLEPEVKAAEEAEAVEASIESAETAEVIAVKKPERIEAEQHIHKQVKSIVFSILSPKMIKAMASAKIVTPELYDKDGYPVDGGLMDIRLGVIDPGLRCKTCGEKLKKCVGHFGYIELARPVYHINYIKTIYYVLRAVCKGCSKVMVDEKTLQIVRKKLEKLQEEGIPEDIRQLSKKILTQAKGTVKCPHCSERQSVIKFEKPSSFLEGEIKLSPVEVSLRLEKIPNEDAELMGFNPRYARPEWGILTV